MEPYSTFHYVQGESNKDSGNMNDEGRPTELSFPSFGFPFSLFLSPPYKFHISSSQLLCSRVPNLKIFYLFLIEVLGSVFTK